MTTLEDYKAHHKQFWEMGTELSAEYRKDANRLLLSGLGAIISYEAINTGQPHPMDVAGYDVHIKLDFGFGKRIRSIDKMHHGDFTVDEKEWSHEINDSHYYYFYAYGHKPKIKHQLDFWMIFDYRKLKTLVKNGVIKPSSNPRNTTWSTVRFYGFMISDLWKNNLIIDYDGVPDALNSLGLPTAKTARIDRVGEI